LPWPAVSPRRWPSRWSYGEHRYVSASVGMSFAAPGSDAQALLRDADAAMYRAKEMGKGRCEIFDESMRRDALERLELESGLREALELGELRLVYQPLVELADGRVTGVEALLRWDHPVHGVVGPLRFIPIAERTGLIIPIGAWVLHEACRQLAEWGDEALGVSVNVSSRQFGATDLVETVRSALDESGIAAERLCLEITETAMMADVGAMGEALTALKRLGVRLAVDDFGVGHASLRRLRSLLPVDTLKIDKSFVDGIAEDADDAAIVEGVVRLAHSLGLHAVAEGVETAEQVAMLNAWSCQSRPGLPLRQAVRAGRHRAAARGARSGLAAVPALAQAAPPALGPPHCLGVIDALAHPAARRRQLGGLRRRDRQRHPALRDTGDLGRVDEALTRAGVHDDAVEDVLAAGLPCDTDRAYLNAVRRADRRSALEDLPGDRVSVVVRH
jgi:EAL domain-containing protein (putative c-di-GMP-specific phosphodiesterase class I)